VRFGETLSLSGLRPSVGSVGDAYDNALAETTIGRYKNECIRADSPFRHGPLRALADVEPITADYVSWFNQRASCTASAESHTPKPKPSTIPNT
jgi:putative transposase